MVDARTHLRHHRAACIAQRVGDTGTAMSHRSDPDKLERLAAYIATGDALTSEVVDALMDAAQRIRIRQTEDAVIAHASMIVDWAQ